MHIYRTSLAISTVDRISILAHICSVTAGGQFSGNRTLGGNPDHGGVRQKSSGTTIQAILMINGIDIRRKHEN
jgi:hypothetical protein